MPRTFLLRSALLALPLAALSVPAAPTTATAAPAPTAQTATFTYTGAEQAWVVPAEVHHVRVEAAGAGGGYGDGAQAPGGAGSLVGGLIDVTPGQTLYVLVGGPGRWWQDGQPHVGGFNGGGGAPATGGTGGGASDVRTVSSAEGAASLESRLVVAAGGGGGGGGYAASAAGGAGDHDGSSPYELAPPGRAGTGSAGGAGMSPGAFGVGGSSTGNGGGGGGGWYGGGAGQSLAGGGGGSSLVPAAFGTGPTPAGVEAFVSLTPVEPPTITASTDTNRAWSAEPVTVSFTCEAGGSPVTDCSDPVTVSDDGEHTVTGSVTDADGFTRTTSVTVRIDRTAPTVSLRGVRHGATYANPRRGTCHVVDAGPASCRIARSAVRRGHRSVVTYTATATDGAGNHSTTRTRFSVVRSRTFLASAPSFGGVYQLRPGRAYPLVVLTSSGRPSATDPLTGAALKFQRVGRGGKWQRWRAVVRPGAGLRAGVVRTVRITADGKLRQVRITRDPVRAD